MEVEEITDHRDGFALNDAITVKPIDDVGPGGAHHMYVAEVDGVEVARVQFQCGPRNEPGSTPGVTHMAMIALLLHPLRAFQKGPFPSRETALAITDLESALNWMHKRVRDRAKRGVLGKSEK